MKTATRFIFMMCVAMLYPIANNLHHLCPQWYIYLPIMAALGYIIGKVHRYAFLDDAELNGRMSAFIDMERPATHERIKEALVATGYVKWIDETGGNMCLDRDIEVEMLMDIVKRETDKSIEDAQAKMDACDDYYDKV